MSRPTEPKPGTSSKSPTLTGITNDLWNMFRDSSGTTNVSPDVWIPPLRDKIVTMLKTPLKQEYNSEVYKWIFQLCTFKKHFTWLCSDPIKGWTREEAKNFSFITRSSLNELLILLPHIKHHLIGGDQVDIEDGKVMCRPASAEQYHQFDTHLMILEGTIQSMVRDEDDNDNETSSVSNPNIPSKLTDAMEPNELKSLLERMKEVLVEVFDYLELVHKNWAQLVATPTSLQFCASQGALRIALVWVSEDVGSFQPQCKNFFIDLIIKYLLARELLPDTMPDLLVMALDAICIRGDDEGDSMKRQFKNTPHWEDAIHKYLNLVELSRIDLKYGGPRSVRRREKEFKFRGSLIKGLVSLKDL